MSISNIFLICFSIYLFSFLFANYGYAIVYFLSRMTIGITIRILKHISIYFNLIFIYQSRILDNIYIRLVVFQHIYVYK